tara:strand:+ start:321 stop:893 length:573 start_codon:yes stop_codon:yes gene_type:complete
MDPKLKAILQRAKEIDNRARKYDSVDSSILENSVNSRLNSGGNSGGNGLYDQLDSTQSTMPQQENLGTPNQLIKAGTDNYNQKVKESKLPPEIMKAMLDNPISQPDMPGTFGMDEETLREINPNYGKQQLSEIKQPNPQLKSVDNGSVRKMIAEEIAKALPSIVEKYFDKELIKENVKILKSLKIRPKKT